MFPGGGFRASGLAASAADGDVAEGAALGPVPAATFAEVAGLGEAVIVVVTEFGVGGGASGAIGSHFRAAFPVHHHPRLITLIATPLLDFSIYTFIYSVGVQEYLPVYIFCVP